MAKILLGATIGDARGSAGAITYSKNQFGAYIRQKVSPVQPRTSRQTQVRQFFSDLSIRWGSVLLDAQRTAWRALATVNPVIDVFGNSQVLTGLQLFQRVNRNLQECTVATIDDAPPDQGVATINAISVVASAGAQTIVLTFDPTPVGAPEYMLVFATAPMSPGKAFYKPLLRFISVLSSGTATGQGLANNYIAKFGAIPLGQRIGFKACKVNTDNGAASSDQYFDCIVGA